MVGGLSLIHISEPTRHADHYDIDKDHKTVRERIAAYNALPQALGAIPSLEHYIARASDMPEAKAQRAADIKERYRNYLDTY